MHTHLRRDEFGPRFQAELAIGPQMSGSKLCLDDQIALLSRTLFESVLKYSAVAQISGATKSDLNIWITIDCSGKVCGKTWTQPYIIAMVKGYPLEKLDFSGNNRL